MIKLYDACITDVLPTVVSEMPEVKALGYAINKQIKNLIDKSEAIRIMAAIDSMPEKIIDIMAIELRSEYYDETMPIEAKRKIIKNTLYRHQKAGTAEAVEELIGVVFGKCELEEWFDYEGEPYHFKAKVDISNTIMNTERFNLAQNIISKVKNKRSKLEKISYRAEHKQQMNMGVVARAGKITTIIPSTEVRIDVSTEQKMYVGTYVRTAKKVTIQGGN